MKRGLGAIYLVLIMGCLLLKTGRAAGEKSPTLSNRCGQAGTLTIAETGCAASTVFNAAVRNAGEESVVDFPSGFMRTREYGFPATKNSDYWMQEEASSMFLAKNDSGMKVEAEDSNFPKDLQNATHGFRKFHIKNTDARPLIWYDYTNGVSKNSSEWVADHTGVMINAQSTLTSAGSMNAQQIFLYSNGLAGYGGFDIGETNTIYKHGTNWTWNAVFQSSRVAHDPVTYNGITSLSHEYNLEIDMSGSGPDESASAFDPMKSSKAMVLLSSWTDSAIPWGATAFIRAGDARTYQIDGVWQLFVAEQSGVTGSVAPKWVIDHSKAFKDGTVMWRYSTTVASQIGTAIRLSSQNNGMVSYGTFLSSDATYYNAVMDFSKVRFLTDKNVVLRMPKEAGIDFTGDGTALGKNNHWLGYTANDGKLEYDANGKIQFAVYDNGFIFANSATFGGNATISKGVYVTGGVKTDDLNVTSGASIRNRLVIPFGTPSSSLAPCQKGQMQMDERYIYSCVAMNTWHRMSNGEKW
ncbi:hypothetical protein [Acidomonas methanolica]|uniref:hypothetical protein n=1 Tax=Acidomonas methanolica TaxID=437 RepID=UPI00211A3C3C|nr:hypothetical protein [Acidomonas methanolica]MCQ9156411.1 hypothetical protein [Acidomonas methanolica]